MVQVREHFGHFGTSVNWDRYGKLKDTINKNNSNLLVCEFIGMNTVANDAFSLP